MTKTLVATPEPPSGPCGCWANLSTPPDLRQPLQIESQPYVLKVCLNCGQAWTVAMPAE